MAFDPTKPVEGSEIDARELRNQFNALQAQITAWQQQFAPLAPVLNRSAGGQWTLSYAGPKQDFWQIWARSSGNTAWANSGELSSSSLPAPDSDVVPEDASWWQVKFCGENDEGNPCTPFSNVISFGPVPPLA
jgi:hypothetical protein